MKTSRSVCGGQQQRRSSQSSEKAGHQIEKVPYVTMARFPYPWRQQQRQA
jgi:hypothetical protein